MAVTYYIYPYGPGWRVHSRGFVWDFERGQEAVEFASDMAAQYARASGQSTNVRFQDGDGGFHDLKTFEGADEWLPRESPPPERPAIVVPLRRKGH